MLDNYDSTMAGIRPGSGKESCVDTSETWTPYSSITFTSDPIVVSFWAAERVFNRGKCGLGYRHSVVRSLDRCNDEPMSDVPTPVAYVTGASRGIGRLIATALANDGALTVGFARPSEDLDSLRNEQGTIEAIPMDVTDPSSVTDAFSNAVESVGPPTLLVTCAGSIDALGPIVTVDPELWWNAVAVDLRGTMLCAQASLPLMSAQGAGRIVTVYGNLGDDGLEHVSAFAAAKAGIARFAETLAAELSGTGVLAVCIHPGFVRTAMTESMAYSDEGRAWLPEFAERAADHWGEGDGAVDLVRRISAGHADTLGGRIIHVADDLDDVSEVCASDPDRRRLRIGR